MEIQQQVNLQPFNTFGLSAFAERFVRVTSTSDIEAYFAEERQFPSLVLGGGSNMLLTQDVAGTVLKIDIPGIEVVNETAEHVYVKVGGGVVWHEFVLHAISQGWGGIENLSLIPGNVGAAPMQNIGAYGVEIRSVFDHLEAYIAGDQSWQSFNLDACRFGYRESVFKQELKNQAIIANVTFRLNKQHTFNTSYGAIDQQLEKMGVEDLSIQAVSDAVIAIRQSKLPDPKEIGNSGSFFKNPVIDQVHFERLQTHFPSIVGYPAGERRVKVAAGWLIETAGFKGLRRKNYGVHDKQALVLVNHGGATGEEIYQLSEEIIQKIRSMFEISLQREVNII